MSQDLDALRLTNGGGVTFLPPDGWAWFHIDNGPPNRPIGVLRFSHGNFPGEHPIMFIDQNQNVSIEGNIFARGGFIPGLGTGDCAEEFPAVEGTVREPGTVMVLGDAGRLQSSEKAYDSRVAGVVSGAGPLRPGLILGKSEGDSQADRVIIGLVGKVYCKVDANASPISVGDLLTTSDIPGRAMRAQDQDRAFGSVLGKAFAPLATGLGEIPILLALR